MTILNYLTFLAALIFVLALFLLIAWLMRRFGLGGAMPALGKNRRLAVVETLSLDPRRRLVLVRRDDTEHLLLLSADQAVVVERNIGPAFPALLPGEHQPELPQ